MIYKNKNILIFGLGKSGIACLKYLQKHACQLFIYDADKSILKKYKKSSVNIIADDNLQCLDLVILSPGISKGDNLLTKILSLNIPVISELEFAYQNLKSKNIIAITGTNGKTTTTELCSELLSNNYKVYKCGNIGLPVTDCVNKVNKDDFVVIEVSSFMLEEVQTFAPKIAIITNLAEDHLDRYNSVQDYQQTKIKITKNQKKEDYLILNENLENYNIQTNARKYFFSTNKEVVGVYCNNGKIYFKKDINIDAVYIANINKIHLYGEYNLENILASVCCAILCGIDKQSIQNVINNFNCIEHRFEKITTINGVEFVNDSKATNIHATLHAVKDVKAVVHLLLGGSDKGEDFDKLFLNLPSNVKAYLFGSTTNKMVNSCLHVGFKNFKICFNMKDALEKAYSNAKKKEMVLLSPACASFDSFTSFEERGKQFKEWVFSLYEKME